MNYNHKNNTANLLKFKRNLIRDQYYQKHGKEYFDGTDTDTDVAVLCDDHEGNNNNNHDINNNDVNDVNSVFIMFKK